MYFDVIIWDRIGITIGIDRMEDDWILKCSKGFDRFRFGPVEIGGQWSRYAQMAFRTDVLPPTTSKIQYIMICVVYIIYIYIYMFVFIFIVIHSSHDPNQRLGKAQGMGPQNFQKWLQISWSRDSMVWCGKTMRETAQIDSSATKFPVDFPSP